MARPWRGVIEEYRNDLPVTPPTSVITLGEGGTPLVESGWLSELTGCTVYVKVEGDNPTGSFKDRGMTVAVSAAVDAGAKVVACASTGNTSASAAAYAARAGLRPVVLVPAGRIAKSKLVQAMVFGATLLQLDGNFDDCLRVARELTDSYPVVLVNSAAQDGMRLAGQQTAAYEVVDQLGSAPDLHLLPVGNAGNITAYWAGYQHYRAGSGSLPRMLGFQAAGAAPIVRGERVPEPETVATAIRVGNPARWSDANAALAESGGRIEAVPDEEILAAQARLAAREGIFVEPASAVGIAGLLRSHATGAIEPGQRIVITVTGNGLKDTEVLRSEGAGQQNAPSSVLPADTRTVARTLDLL